MDQVVGYETKHTEPTSTEPRCSLRPVPILHESDDRPSNLTISGPFNIVDISPHAAPQLAPRGNDQSKISVVTTIALPSIDNVTTPDSSSCRRTSSKSKSAAPAESSTDSEADGMLLLGLYNSYTPLKSSIASETQANNESITIGEAGAVTHTTASWTQHNHALSDATTLRGSTSRVLPDDEFRMRLQNEYQTLATVQGDRKRRAVEEDQAKKDNQSMDLLTMPQQIESGGNNALEEQANAYEALLTKAKNDSVNALAEAEDLHNDEMKYLRQDIEKAHEEHNDKIKVIQKELEAAQSRKSMFEKRLKKVLEEQKSATTEHHALLEKCKAHEDIIALKDKQILRMSSSLLSGQEELDGLRGLYETARTSANQNARLVEENGVTITDLRQNIHILTGQLEQAPEAALIVTLRDENRRLLSIVAEDHSLLEAAAAKFSSLTQALAQAKREHDRWFDHQLSPMAEDSLSNPTKIANHIAYKDKLYEDLEKRFQAYTAVSEEEQKKACEGKNEADESIVALKKDLKIQTEAVEKASKDKMRHRSEMARIYTTTLSEMPQEAFVEGLSFHFDLVQRDNHVLASRVAELDEDMTNLEQAVTAHEREKRNLAKELAIQKENGHQLKAAKDTVMGELDALKYTIEVAEECHKEEVHNCQASITHLSTEIKAMGDKFSALNHCSANERIQFELSSMEEFIQTLRSRMHEIHQAFVQASNERDHYRRVTQLDQELSNCFEHDLSFFQRQLALSEARFAELESNLNTANLMNIRRAREYKEAWEAEKVRVEELEKELHKLYQNLQVKASSTAADTQRHVTAAKPPEDKSAAIEDLARQLWSRMCGLEITLKALGKSIVEPANEREQLRLACDKILGLWEDEEDGPPENKISVEDARDADVGDYTPNGEDSESEDKLDGDGANVQVAEQQDDHAVAQSIIDDACDQLGYAVDEPRRVLGCLGTEEGTEGAEETEESEDAAGSDSSTEAVLSEEDSRHDLENPEELDVGSEDAPQSATHDSSSNVPSDGTESSNGNDDDARTITQVEYDAAITTTPQHAPASTQEAVQDEDDADESMNMTPGTWARRYAPPFLYGEPVEDDIF